MAPTCLDQAIGKAADRKKSFPFFNKLPKDILENHLLPYLNLEADPKTRHSLALATKQDGFLFRCNLRLIAFLESVANSNENKVRETLKKASPLARQKLLTTPFEVINYSGRRIYGTALQIALGADDVNLAKILMNYMDKLPDGDIIKQKQIKEQFPEGYAKEIEQQANDSLKALLKLFDIIRHSNNENDWEIALGQFKNSIKPQTVIKNGKQFNKLLLFSALQLYQQTYGFGWAYPHPEENYYLANVVNYLLQHYLPACYVKYLINKLLSYEINLSKCDLGPKTLTSALYFTLHTAFSETASFFAKVPEKEPLKDCHAPESWYDGYIVREFDGYAHVCDDKGRKLHRKWWDGEFLLESYRKESKQRSDEIAAIIESAYHPPIEKKSSCVVS